MNLTIGKKQKDKLSMAHSLKQIYYNLKKELTVETNRFWIIILKNVFVSILLFLSFFISEFVYVSLSVCLIFILTEKGAKKIYFLIYLFPSFNVFSYQVGGMTLAMYPAILIFLLLGIEYIIKVVKKQEKIDYIFLSLVMAVVIFGFINNKDFIKYLQVMAFVLLAAMCYLFRKELNLKEIFFVIGTGLLMSCLMFFAHPLSDRLSQFLNLFSSFANSESFRFCGLEKDPNFFSANIIIILSALLVLFLNKKINILFYLGTILFSIFGILSESKMFIIIFFVWIALSFVFLFFENNKIEKKLKRIVFFMLSICLLSVITINSLNAILSRLSLDTINYPVKIETQLKTTPHQNEISVVGDNNLSNLTTGRSDIWQAYSKYFIANPTILFFGNGIGAELDISYESNGEVFSYDFASHNTFLQIIYHLGLVGLILLFAPFFYCFAKSKKVFKLSNLTPLLFIVLTSFALDFLFSSLKMLVIILVIGYSLYDQAETKNIINKEKVRVANEK